MKKTVYIGLGSNVGDRAAQIEAAIAQLGALGAVTARSSLYETEPMEMPNQPWFLNGVVALETELMPKQLLGRLLDIERSLGRKRNAAQPKGPRTIDLDILLFAGSIIDTAGLTIPHPAMHQRRFVLEPLAEIAPDVRHPVFKRTIRELRDALPKDSGAARRVDSAQWTVDRKHRG